MNPCAAEASRCVVCLTETSSGKEGSPGWDCACRCLLGGGGAVCVRAVCYLNAALPATGFLVVTFLSRAGAGPPPPCDAVARVQEPVQRGALACTHGLGPLHSPEFPAAARSLLENHADARGLRSMVAQLRCLGPRDAALPARPLAARPAKRRRVHGTGLNSPCSARRV